MASRLPQVARDRAVRLKADSPSAWAGDAGSLVALQAVGFEFVGEVMGCIGATLTRDGPSMCSFRSGTARVRLGGSMSSSWAVSYPRRAEQAYRTAIERLRAEAGARGADGVIGIRRVQRMFEGDLVETTLTGLAVRARSSVRPARAFLTTYSAPQVAALLGAGWVPVDLHVAVQLGVRHDDTAVEHVDQLRMTRQNLGFEVPGFAELLGTVRGSVRDKLRAQLQAVGADGATIGHIEHHSWHAECVQLGARTDRVVRADAWADSLARFGPRTARPPTRTLTVMPLSRKASTEGAAP